MAATRKHTMVGQNILRKRRQTNIWGGQNIQNIIKYMKIQKTSGGARLLM